MKNNKMKKTERFCIYDGRTMWISIKNLQAAVDNPDL